MIQNDHQLQAMQKRIRLFEDVLKEARKTYLPEDYEAMSQGYLLEIKRMQEEIRVYLSCAEEQLIAA
jgi:DUF1365 family protein